MNFEKPEKSETSEKMKKFVGDITILHMCTKNHNHMKSSSWDMKRDRIFCNFGLFFAFLHPPPLTDPKINTSKKWKKKKNLQISFYKSVPKITIKCRTVPEIWCVMEVIIFTFWANFCTFTLITAQITKLQKNVYHR